MAKKTKPFDEDDFEWTQAAFAKAKPLREVDPGMIEAMTRLRKAGRPRLDKPKVHTSLRLDVDVINWLKSSGRGYQTRANNLLRAAMQMNDISREKA
jgi:uncharacterized protein (DUF4415 family)